jgi:hypothetical protein
MKKAVLFFAVLIVAIPCLARTISVDDDGPADFGINQAVLCRIANGSSSGSSSLY